jgi:hypothetical protein
VDAIAHRLVGESMKEFSEVQLGRESAGSDTDVHHFISHVGPSEYPHRSNTFIEHLWI